MKLIKSLVFRRDTGIRPWPPGSKRGFLYRSHDLFSAWNKSCSGTLILSSRAMMCQKISISLALIMNTVKLKHDLWWEGHSRRLVTSGDLLVLAGKTDDKEDQRMASHLTKALRPTGVSQGCHDDMTADRERQIHFWDFKVTDSPDCWRTPLEPPVSIQLSKRMPLVWISD